MREELGFTDRLAICTFTLRNRTRLCDENADRLAALRGRVKARGGSADANEGDDVEKRLPPPAVGSGGGSSGFDFGDVDVESGALDLGPRTSSVRKGVAKPQGSRAW